MCMISILCIANNYNNNNRLLRRSPHFSGSALSRGVPWRENTFYTENTFHVHFISQVVHYQGVYLGDRENTHIESTYQACTLWMGRTHIYIENAYTERTHIERKHSMYTHWLTSSHVPRQPASRTGRQAGSGALPGCTKPFINTQMNRQSGRHGEAGYLKSILETP